LKRNRIFRQQRNKMIELSGAPWKWRQLVRGHDEQIAAQSAETGTHLGQMNFGEDSGCDNASGSHPTNGERQQGSPAV
jgi:hypothetical protein